MAGVDADTEVGGAEEEPRRAAARVERPVELIEEGDELRQPPSNEERVALVVDVPGAGERGDPIALAPSREGEHGVEVTRQRRIAHGAEEPLRRLGPLPAARELVGHEDRRDIPPRGEPSPRDEVRLRPVGGAQGLVRGLADQRVAEGPGALVAAPGLVLGDDELLAAERLERLARVVGRGRSREERRDVTLTEALTEDARGAQAAPRRPGQGAEPRLYDGQDGVGHRVQGRSLRGRAEDLFEEECVAARHACDALDVRRGALGAEHLAGEALGRADPEGVELDRRRSLERGERRPRARRVGPGCRHEEDRSVVEGLPHVLEETEGHRVGPVEVFEHQEEPGRRGLGAEPVRERRGELAPHRQGVVADGGEDPIGVARGAVPERADELRHVRRAVDPGREEPRGHVRPERLPARWLLGGGGERGGVFDPRAPC